MIHVPQSVKHVCLDEENGLFSDPVRAHVLVFMQFGAGKGLVLVLVHVLVFDQFGAGVILLNNPVRAHVPVLKPSLEQEYVLLNDSVHVHVLVFAQFGAAECMVKWFCSCTFPCARPI